LFRRDKNETTDTVVETPSSTTGATAGKGRPTPTRKEAEAARKAKAKTPRTRKEQAAAQRAARSTRSQEIRHGMKTGDERYLPPRDKGPVRRFIRDYVDTRLSFVELMLPLLIVTLILGYSGNPRLASIGNLVLLGTLVLVILDMLFLRMRLRRELKRRFPDAPLKGTTYYAISRSLQMKFMRLPKAQVKLGQTLPETYR
jgi:Flp pilus assembly protein TadB